MILVASSSSARSRLAWTEDFSCFLVASGDLDDRSKNDVLKEIGMHSQSPMWPAEVSARPRRLAMSALRLSVSTRVEHPSLMISISPSAIRT